ncbi:HNH endonuclease [Colwellia psychrerythraea]|uniref:HNH nuclease domain-containing protein n=1 Tax=Colwellia psychrerythraea TaxID=28229 RepID=A0A099KUJ6_COLPS|nr:HNH endonuclease [Colwellia psychrerythraea]KGJ93333.1 hypothetical protein GAB14E_2657 [Colwellia psychrerythraea]
MINKALKHYGFNKDNDIRYEYPNGYGKHKKKVVLTVYQCEPVVEVYLDDINFTVIDIASLTLLESNAFIAHRRNDGQLCARANGESRAYLHRLIVKPSNTLQVDHINHCPLDNRLSNLRECSAKQNNIAKRNSRINRVLNTGLIGVSHLNEESDEPAIYMVVHPIDGFYPDKFTCEHEAAQFRDERFECFFMGKYHDGQWFTLNFINWNFEPEERSVTSDAARDYDGYMGWICQKQIDDGIEWLKQQHWAKSFYDSFIAKYEDDD